VNEVTVPGGIAFGLPAPYACWKLMLFAAGLGNEPVSQAVIVLVRPEPVSVTPVIVVADPGLLSENVRLEVEVVAGSAVTPP